MSKILVIDDSDSTSFAVQTALPEYQVLYAADGIEGLDLFRQHLAEIVLVVLDIQMPHLDGRATCLKIRSLNQQVPIVPFTGFPHDHTLSMLRELGCFSPLIKPAHPALIAKTLRAALESIPPSPTPSTALLTYAQELATAQEQAGRVERASRVMIYAASLSTRKGLKALMEKAGVSVALMTNHANNVRDSLAVVNPIALITTLGDLPGIQALALEHGIPLLTIASTLAEGLTLADISQQVDMPRLGIIVERQFDEDDLSLRLAAALNALDRGNSFVPRELLQPFAAIPLPPQEQVFLGLEARGLSSRDIADKLKILPGSVRQYRLRISKKLDVAEGQSLQHWAEAWWFAQICTHR